MQLFYVKTHGGQGYPLSAKVWMIVADTLSKAVDLVPSDYRIDAVDAVNAVEDCADAPARVIGWMGERTIADLEGTDERIEH